MANEDMSNILETLSGMLNSNNMPDNMKDMLNSLKNSNESDTQKSTSSNSSIDNESINSFINMISNSNSTNNQTNSDSTHKYDNSSPSIDFEMLIKMKKIIDKMNNNKDDPRANLLKSLKPYLKESRKEKVDQYIKLFNMSKVMEVFNSSGGDEKK